MKGLRAVRPDARVFRKSGTWRDRHAEGDAVEGVLDPDMAARLAEMGYTDQVRSEDP